MQPGAYQRRKNVDSGRGAKPTYELDGLQYVVAPSGGTLFAFVLN